MKEINCPCCKDGKLKYVNYNDTHIWVCDKCPIVMFEYYDLGNTETVMHYLEKENKQVRLENEEYNVLQVLSSKSKMDCWFDLREDEQGNDYVYDLENDIQMSLCEGLAIFNDGLTDLEDYKLTDEEKTIYNNLIRRVVYGN